MNDLLLTENNIGKIYILHHTDEPFQTKEEVRIVNQTIDNKFIYLDWCNMLHICNEQGESIGDGIKIHLEEVNRMEKTNG